MTAKRNALGRGLAALIRDASGDAANQSEISNRHDEINKLPLAALRGGKLQPRKHFDEESIKNLARSIKSSGMVQPILVRPMETQDTAQTTYEIIAGERRFRAAQLAELHLVPVIIRKLSDKEALQIALIENLQREELNPIEEAEALLRLQKEFGYEQHQIADIIGKSRPHITNMVRLLNLPEKVQTLIAQQKISASHGRALVRAANAAALAEMIVEENLSVRQAEELAEASHRLKRPPPAMPASAPTPSPAAMLAKASPRRAYRISPDNRALMRKLSNILGLAVEINHRNSGAGELRIRYRTLDQLEKVIEKLIMPASGESESESAPPPARQSP